MINQFRPIAILTGILLLISGCELYYVPPHLQTPTHEKKGDIAANFQGLYTYSGSASYAVTNSIFIGGSFMGYTNGNDSTENDYFRTSTVEGGYYYFDTTNNFHLEVMGGFGVGQAGDANGFEVDFNRFFIQPGIAFLHKDRIVENHLNFRFSNIGYGRQITNQVNPFNVAFFEPSYTLRLGSPNIKFHMQLGFSVPVSSSSVRPIDFAFDPLIIGFGLNAKLNAFGKVNGK